MPDLIDRVQHLRVVVVGAGIAGLVAAREWAKVGARVTVLEAGAAVGGSLQTISLDGLPVDVVADAFPLAAPEVAALIDDLGLRGDVEPAAGLPAWVAGRGVTAPLPGGALLGIPANAWADDVRRVVGWRGAWRAYLDRVRPPLTIGREQSLGRLVTARMGDRVTRRLVAPISRGLYGVDPDEVDADAAIPGLSAALTRAGSLAGAISELLPDAGAHPARATLRGGLGRLTAALAAQLADLGADLRTGTAVTALTRDAGPGADAWSVTLEPDARGLDHPGAQLAADVVIVATGAVTAVRLLATAGIRLGAAPVAPVRDVVTLIVDAPVLDAAPRGRAAYPVDEPAADGALAVAHASAEWPWLAAAAGPGIHVLRVTLPAVTAGEEAALREPAQPRDPASPTTPAPQLVERARAAAADLLGVALPAPRAAAHRRVVAAPPASAIGYAQRVAEIRATVAAMPGLAVVGGWLSGSGIAQVVADATHDADRLRGAVLWGGRTPGETDS